MGFPPIDKTFQGLMKETLTRLTLVERRLAKGVAAIGTGGRLSPTGQQITDWDQATEVGFYWGYNALNAPSPIDGSTNNWFAGHVTYHGGNTPGEPRFFQEVREARSAMHPIVYRRYWNNTSWTAWVAIEEGTSLSTTDLNTVVISGWYVQMSNSNATTARNYPSPAGRAGELEVVANTAGTDFVMQRYTDYMNNEVWRRTMYNGTWYAWRAESAEYVLPGRLEATTAIKIVSDANDALEAGWYKAVSAANTPVGTAAGSIFVFRANSNNQAIQQDFRRVYTTGSLPDIREWSRVSIDNGATWTAWVQVAGDDSGWITPTLLNGFTNGGDVAYREKDGICYLRGELLNATMPASPGVTAFTLPAGFRPTHRVRQLNWASNITNLVGVTVNSGSGNVDVGADYAKTSTPGYHINCSFPID